MSGTSRWILRFARRSPGVGVHLAIRAIGFPRFQRVVDALPREGRILDMGCGHGLLAILIASSSPEREVVGVDVLQSRLDIARRIARDAGLSNLRFECRDFATPPEGKFAAIVFSDSLFYYPLEQQETILDDCRERLDPGGLLVVKEQGVRPAWKAWCVRRQERLVVGLKTSLGGSREWRRIAPDGVYLWSVDRLAGFLRSRGLSVVDEPLDAGSYLSHYLIIARDPGRS